MAKAIKQKPIPKPEAKKKTGRPKANIDWDQVGAMLEAGATSVGIAATIGCDEATMRKRCPGDNKCTFSQFAQQKRAKGDEILRVAQFETAKGGNVTMQIWLGKQRLGQSDKQEITTDPRVNELKSRIQRRAEEKGVTYEQERDYFLANYADNVQPEVKTKLASELVQ